MDRDKAKRLADKYIQPKGARGKKKAKDAPKEWPTDAGETPAPSSTSRIVTAMPKLSPKEAQFVHEYVVDFNATQAAIRAGYSQKTARQIGYETLRKPHVRAAVDAAKRDLLERADVDADMMLKLLVRDVHADINDLFDDRDVMRPMKDWPPEFRKGLIAGLETEELFDGTGEARVMIGYTKKIRFADRTAIKIALGKHTSVGAFKDRVEVDASSKLIEALGKQIDGSALRPKE